MQIRYDKENMHTNIIKPGDVVLVAVAHPDDETVLEGELIRSAINAGAELHIAFATVGEQSTVNSRFWEPDFVRAGKRWQEVHEAAKRLGVKQTRLHLLHLPDGQVKTHIHDMVDELGELLRAENVTIAATTGPQGYDKHPDHIAVDTAMVKAIQLLDKKRRRKLLLLRLDSRNRGSIVFPVDTQNKIWATIGHFSQFPGVRVLGKLLLPRQTKEYLAHYKTLVYKKETYNAIDESKR